jgi:hypothetical protein
MPSIIKHPAPPKVRPKVGSKRSRNALLATGQQYVSGQASADPGNKLQTLAQAVSTSRTSLVALLGTRSNLKAQLDTTQGAIVTSDAQYGEALTAYATGAAIFCNGDPSLLASLGVAQAASPTKPADETTGTPVLKVEAGPSVGAARLKCARVAYAGSYVFQYKLEPSQPTDPWLATISTKLASTIVAGLAPEQLIRARAQAVGVVAGAWSVEVVGRAK